METEEAVSTGKSGESLIEKVRINWATPKVEMKTGENEAKLCLGFSSMGNCGASWDSLITSTVTLIIFSVQNLCSVFLEFFSYSLLFIMEKSWYNIIVQQWMDF